MTTMYTVTREEHPTPQFQRTSFTSLNGQWQFEFDDGDAGLSESWYTKDTLNSEIRVPFVYQSELSGIGDKSFHDVVWYRRSFRLDDVSDNQRVFLHFGASDYSTQVWVNGSYVGDHDGGHTPFMFDITEQASDDENILVVRVQDFSRDLELPRGKQYWEEHSESIFYTRTTGIWQSVWLELVHETHINSVQSTPNFDDNSVTFEVGVSGLERTMIRNAQLRLVITFEEEVIATQSIPITKPQSTVNISLVTTASHQVKTWSPESPNLYDVSFELFRDDELVDHVSSYFGVRKVSVENGIFLLNNRSYFMRLVLDQGYFPDGILTPPSDEALRHDVELVKSMGFNGVRKHQKVEDPRFLYWCDKLGLLVWGEMANAYAYSDTAVRRLISEWQEVVKRDYNHPCIVAWVPLNESWGTPNLIGDARQRAYISTLYFLTKALDETRLVISNDGWEHTFSDLCTIHDYEPDRTVLTSRYSSRDNAVHATPGHRVIYAPGHTYQGQPILVTEMGGISYKKSDWNGWGYSSAESDEDFISRYHAVIQAMYDSPILQGFCYTQFTDVEQEINGLLTYDRQPKVSIDIIKSITEGKGVPSK